MLALIGSRLGAADRSYLVVLQKARAALFLPIAKGILLLGYLLTLFDAPIFLFRNRKLFANSIVYVFWHWSFGHTILGLDYASRLYYPHRISLIYIPDPGSNPYLPLCFKHNMDIYIYKSLFSCVFEQIERWVGLAELRKAQYRTLRLFVLLWSGVTNRFQAIDQHGAVYRALSVAADGLRFGHEASGQVVKQADYTGYLRLLEANVGRPPKMPEHLYEKCCAAIRAKYPDFFSKPFVTILLRKKGQNSGEFNNILRCAGPAENYLPAVAYLTENGYHVAGTGETEHAVFEHIPGYYSLQGIELPPKLLNLFLLMHCKLYIGQSSGPNWLGSAVGRPSLVCDGILYSGTFRSGDILLYKPLYQREDGRRLSLVEIFRSHADLVCGYNYAKKGIKVGCNTSAEILEAVKESLLALEGRLMLTDEDRKLCEKFAALLPSEAIIRYQGNRPTLHLLRQHKEELLGAA